MYFFITSYRLYESTHIKVIIQIFLLKNINIIKIAELVNKGFFILTKTFFLLTKN